MPDKVVSLINFVKLQEFIKKSSNNLLLSEKQRATKCIDYLEKGAPAFPKTRLGPCVVKNSKAAFVHGLEVTDSIATWIKKGFVAGPFFSPPVSILRANSILAIPQTDKVRICINVSLPAENNLNCNITANSLEKIEMSSAKLFSFSILECGTGSKMWKFDFVDAYKNVPVPMEDFRLQGFCWLGAYFIELKQMFGAAASVHTFDIVANTVKSCCLANCEIPRKLVHRQLDDVPVVCPKKFSWGQDFEKTYRSIFSSIGMTLGPDCTRFEKAFSNSTYGKVLDFIFNTENLSWKLPEEKTNKTLSVIANIECKQRVTLLDMQK